jgi:hypothetical protein
MTDLMREILPIAFMYFCVLLLAPFIAYALWMGLEGDRSAEAAMAAAADEQDATVDQATAIDAEPQAPAAEDAHELPHVTERPAFATTA